eukprot:TRINITY_DN26623_c0_g1_i1.p1 TRINITY_DN26623_c0_g1~~TRINITY_DN26623_c0_g1_i1.p1  ORF type:complete len:147 (-),score=50.13 TRINITY_DN26623_c0_g1_i1:54-494(-)
MSDNDIKEAFAAFDTDNDGKINTYELGTIIRALGKAPLQAEVLQMEAEVGDDQIDVATVKKYYNRKMRSPLDYEKELKQAFEALDATGGKVIAEADLRMLLGTLGEPLSSEEIDSLMRCIDFGDRQGNIDYYDFIKLVVGDRVSRK